MKRTILRLSSILAVAAMVGVACSKGDEMNENSNNSAEIKVEVTTADATDIEPKTVKLSATCTITDADGAKAATAFYYAHTNWDTEKIKAEGMKVLSDSIAEGRSTFSVTIDGLESETQYYFVASVTINGKDYFGQVKSFTTLEVKPEAVDLGLSVKWASFNVGASKPEEFGGYYAWGEVETKTEYSWETYKWCKGTEITLTKYCNNSEYGYNGYTDDKYVLDPEDDVAHVEWGGSWRMPTHEEMRELTETCTWTREIKDSIDGVKITGSNGNSIFIPAAGYYSGSEWIISELQFDDSRDLDLWTSTPGDNYKSYFLWLLTGSSKGVSTYDRYRGWSVRPVCP